MKPTSIPNPKEKIEELGRRIDRLRRSVLEPGVLRGLLPIKSTLLRHRMRAPEARAREDRFRAASESYARTLSDDHAFAANARTMELDGLRWGGGGGEGRVWGGAVLDGGSGEGGAGHRGGRLLVGEGGGGGTGGGGARGRDGPAPEKTRRGEEENRPAAARGTPGDDRRAVRD